MAIKKKFLLCIKGIAQSHRGLVMELKRLRLCPGGAVQGGRCGRGVAQGGRCGKGVVVGGRCGRGVMQGGGRCGTR